MNTPYIVHCPQHGGQILSNEEYMAQLRMPDASWCCPECGGIAWFDDQNYENYLQERERQQNQQLEENGCED